jgi:hypothetical protein
MNAMDTGEYDEGYDYGGHGLFRLFTAEQRRHHLLMTHRPDLPPVRMTADDDHQIAKITDSEPTAPGRRREPKITISKTDKGRTHLTTIPAIGDLTHGMAAVCTERTTPAGPVPIPRAAVAPVGHKGGSRAGDIGEVTSEDDSWKTIVGRQTDMDVTHEHSPRDGTIRRENLDVEPTEETTKQPRREERGDTFASLAEKIVADYRDGRATGEVTKARWQQHHAAARTRHLALMGSLHTRLRARPYPTLQELSLRIGNTATILQTPGPPPARRWTPPSGNGLTTARLPRGNRQGCGCT